MREEERRSCLGSSRILEKASILKPMVCTMSALISSKHGIHVSLEAGGARKSGLRSFWVVETCPLRDNASVVKNLNEFALGVSPGRWSKFDSGKCVGIRCPFSVEVNKISADSKEDIAHYSESLWEALSTDSADSAINIMALRGNLHHMPIFPKGESVNKSFPRDMRDAKPLALP